MKKESALNHKALVLIVIISLIFTGCGKKKTTTDGSEKKQKIQLTQVKKRTIENYLDEMGQINPRSITKVKFNFSGKITRLYAEEGDIIKQGQTLALVYPDINQIKTVTGAQINLKQVMADVQRLSNEVAEITSLYKQGLVSKARYDDLESQYSIAQDKVKTARLEMESLQKTSSIENEKAVSVRAPLSGTIINRYVDLGDYIMAASAFQSGTVLFEVAEISDLIIEANINEMDILAIHDGAQVDFTLEALPGKAFKGKVFRVFPTPVNDNNVKKYTVQILPVDKMPSNVRLGMSVRIKVLLVRKEDVLSVALGSVVRDPEEGRDYVLIPQGRMYKKQIIKTGVSDYDNIEVRDGLKEGDEVVKSPYQIKDDEIIDEKKKEENALTDDAKKEPQKVKQGMSKNGKKK